MKSKILAISAIGLGLLILSGAYVLTANAGEETNYPFSSIVKKIAERFNLDESEVQKVFVEAQEERRAEHQARFGERLDEAVKEGKITEAQKNAILEKMAEMEKKHEELESLTLEQRREAMKALREEIEKWAEENGIDLKQFPGLGPKGFRGGFPGLRFGR